MEESVLVPDNLEVPDFNPELQYLGEPTLDEKTKEWYFPVIDFSQSDLKAISIYKAELQRQKSLSIETENKILEESFILSESDALEKQSIFPIWEKLEVGFRFVVGNKYQAFEGDELKLYSVIQDHSKQVDWHPTKVQSLFIKVLPPNASKIWEAGIAVKVGEEYLFNPNKNTYIVIQSHTTASHWTPPVTPSLWKLKVI